MYGSGSLCLLALSILILPTVTLNGQSDRSDPAGDFGRPLSSRMALPSTVVPFRLRLPSVASEVLGFPLIARAAGTIFSGIVTAVARRPATYGQVIETVAITFHVESAIRGAIPGEDLTISQWIGLWAGGQRYHVGERVFLFLYPPSKLGLTSTVGGGDRAFHCRSTRPCLALSTPFVSLSTRSRPGREDARTFQRLRLGGTAGQGG
jgi:hypothetical protein